MRLLLTGEPGSGKTTALINFIDNIPNKTGFWTEEIREAGQRVAFELVSSKGIRTTLARVGFDGPKVGRYGVDIKALEEFLASLPQPGPEDLLYIDEIAPMELVSEKFKNLVREYLSLSNHYAGTIKVKFDDELINEVITSTNVLLIKVTKENREDIGKLLSGIACSLPTLANLDEKKEVAVINLATGYLDNNQYTQVNKLFKNALEYLVKGRVEKNEDDYRVRGNHASHRVTKVYNGWTCDCDLFNGRGPYEGHAGECSHIQAIKLMELYG